MYPYLAEVPQILPLDLLMTKPLLVPPVTAPPLVWSTETTRTAVWLLRGLPGSACRYGPKGKAVVVPVAPVASDLTVICVHAGAAPISVLGSWSRCWSL